MEKRIKEIKPNPLLTSTVEIRFVSNISSEEVLGKFYPVYAKDYPKVTDKGIPRDIKDRDPNLRFTGDYILSNDDYSITIANNVITFESLGDYKLWANYSSIIKDGLEKLKSLSIVKSIVRVGIRYASLFEQKENINPLNVSLAIGYDGYHQSKELFRGTLTRGDVQLGLQIVNEARATRDNTSKEGLYIDIDAYQTENLPSEIGSELYSIIDKLHYEEKGLFEFLISRQYLDKLEVVYQ